ncbi:hypothetical protein DERF_013397 [Dermatophagoides farinae]|uniref:Transmembrane protein n=1 Tax=Dermatophagoides farinae TaxID=6954 RepID=A0A922HPF6_DERFA|nr:hypothetical protein DERF_013397 [Dermatophagoides farinae]
MVELEIFNDGSGGGICCGVKDESVECFTFWFGTKVQKFAFIQDPTKSKKKNGRKFDSDILWYILVPQGEVFIAIFNIILVELELHFVAAVNLDFIVVGVACVVSARIMNFP